MATVLIVDDDDAIRRLSEIVLQRKTSWKVVQARDGHEAIYKSIEHEPDVILLDVMMPKLDGIEVLRYLKSDEICARIPIILITAAVDPNDVARHRELGVLGVITKPFSPAQLVDRICALANLSPEM